MFQKPMMLSTRLRRWTYLTHRWCGVAGCLLMTLWFASGVVMLFVGYPKLTPADRLQALPVLAPDAAYLPPAFSSSAGTSVTSGATPPIRLVLNAADGHPRYVMQQADGIIHVADAISGQPRTVFNAVDAMRAADLFLPQAGGIYRGMVAEDRWTHARGLDSHRPLHMVQMQDAQATLLYLSSHTGEVVMQAPRAQRLWNFAGAWLHWLYAFKKQSVDAVWSWTVIVLSAGCVLVACTGILAGIWRWRFTARYKSGSRSPYQPGWMRWHHIFGLSFAAITLTWIFSGLMSMNPLGIFSAAVRPDVVAYAGARPSHTHLAAAPADILTTLQRGGFDAVELECKTLAGIPFVLARDARDQSRLVLEQQGALVVQAQWPLPVLQLAARRLMPAAVQKQQLLTTYDAYYYRREPQAMMGGSGRRLPVLKLEYGDTGNTWAYIDVHTGQPELTVDRAQRLGRWLFSFLHSWDISPMLAGGWLREALLVILSAGGMALSVSGIVIAWRRVRHKCKAVRKPAV